MRKLVDNRETIRHASRLARKVVLWSAAVESCSTRKAFSVAARRFRLSESNLRTLFLRPQTLKTVPHAMVVNLSVAEQVLLDQITAVEELTAPKERVPERDAVLID